MKKVSEPRAAPLATEAGSHVRPRPRSLLGWIGWSIVLLLALRFVVPLMAGVFGLARGVMALTARGSRLGPALAIALLFVVAVGARYALLSRRNRR